MERFPPWVWAWALVQFLTIFAVPTMTHLSTLSGHEDNPWHWSRESFIDEELGKKSVSQRQPSKLKLTNADLLLPRDVIPISYKLRIRPILESEDKNEVLTAPGSIEVLVKCVNPTDRIVLHAHSKGFVKIHDESLRVHTKQSNPNLTDTNPPNNLLALGGNSGPRVATMSHASGKDDADFYELVLQEELAAGKEYLIFMNFTTKISNKTLDGLYLSKYVDPKTLKDKFVAVTQFEDIAARNMFPCWDEPDLKASFQIIISRGEKYSSMSNMPLEFSEPDPERPGYFLDHYPPTPAMSSYLVALVVSEFTCATAPSFLYNKTVQACGPPHLVKEGGAIHAAQISARILAYYEKFWGVPYPLPKMQSVAIPDFEAGAMENYGLNTYRVAGLFYFPGKTTESGRRRIESTIAHELAHQNFGNLVTCKSWNQIFLNEGFATFVSDLGLESVSPEFRADFDGWYTGYVQRALRADADPDVHSLVKQDAYFGDFDAISYAKGASLIKMMEHIFSRKTLFNGLREYLRAFSFGNTNYNDLYLTLDTHSKSEGRHPGISATDFMEAWTIQPGFPLIRVQRLFPKMFQLSQERFVRHKYSKNISKEAENLQKGSTKLWYCPIYVDTPQQKQQEQVNDDHYQHPTFWLRNTESVKVWTAKSNLDWIVINPNAKAFMRVHYDDELSNAIENQLNTDHTQFSSITRAQLIDDAFECAWSGYNSITVALKRTKFLIKDYDATVWSTLSPHFRQIYNMFSGHPEMMEVLKNYLRPRVKNSLRKVGMEQKVEDRGRIVLHREMLLYWGALVELPVVLEYANELVETAASGDSILTAIPIDIRGEILCAAVAKGEEKMVDKLFTAYQDEPEETERGVLLAAIGCTQNTVAIQSLLQNITNPLAFESKKDSLVLLQRLLINPSSRKMTVEYLRINLQVFSEFYASSTIGFKLLTVLADYWNTQEDLDLMTTIMSEIDTEGMNQEAVQKFEDAAKEKVEENILWMQTYAKDIKEWLESNS